MQQRRVSPQNQLSRATAVACGCRAGRFEEPSLPRDLAMEVAWVELDAPHGLVDVTQLGNSELGCAECASQRQEPVSRRDVAGHRIQHRVYALQNLHRSEEHTSELQSLRHLVC